MSAEQKERFDAAREKRAEEKKAADEKSAQADKSLDETDDEPSGTQILFKSADVEADNVEDLMSKIFSIKWDEIDEEEAFI